jgi:hypothetical protein
LALKTPEKLEPKKQEIKLNEELVESNTTLTDAYLANIDKQLAAQAEQEERLKDLQAAEKEITNFWTFLFGGCL